ncbi:3',5'-cyclic-AMP phosphodiesterase [bacterium endosymbiont of Escarpia laminata]|nr:MAG: 3',5'-cyclic-AMP phosphodiesterase [bacterium endosymbiont of Escarpia laminata]
MSADTNIFHNLPEGSLKVLQLTDCHLYADTSRCLLGLNTQETLNLVSAMALEQLGTPDMILATGDLVHDASETGYQRFRKQFAGFDAPTFCLPGNHDIPEVMARLLNQDGISTIPSTQQGNWSLIFLDSTIPKEPGGHLDESQLELLEDELQKHPDKHTLVCMHHHPVPVDSAWMDSMALNNPEPLFELLAKHKQVKGILCGHIHQVFERNYHNLLLLGSPSTCIQFIAGQDKFGIANNPPGYRWLALLPDGEIRSGVELLQEMPEGVEFNSSGY